MCDALSLASAGTDLLGGMAARTDAKSRMDFETGQLQAMSVLAAARGNDELGALHASMAEAAQQNLAAMAVTGLAAGSFSGIEGGNRRDGLEAGRMILMNVQGEQGQNDVQAMIARAEGRSEMRTALFGALNSAAFTLSDAERSFREANLVQRDAAGDPILDENGEGIPMTRRQRIARDLPGLSRVGPAASRVGARVGSFFRRS